MEHLDAVNKETAMKKFKVTVIQEIELPDDFEIATEPVDQIEALRRGKHYYIPTITWLGREHVLDGSHFGKHETSPGISWSEAKVQDHDLENSTRSEECILERKLEE